jgi:hypothetical protein
MSLGITVYDMEADTERVISRLAARVAIADVGTKVLIEESLVAGKRVATSNILRHVYAMPQGPNTRYKRTFKLLRAVKSGTISTNGAIAAGQVYISREEFDRVYYPVYAEYGSEAGAPYSGRYYWAVTVAELRVKARTDAILLGKTIARGV